MDTSKLIPEKSEYSKEFQTDPKMKSKSSLFLEIPNWFKKNHVEFSINLCGS